MKGVASVELLIVGSDLNAPGSQALKRAASNVGIQAEIVLADAPESLGRIQDATHVLFRLRPKSYEIFTDLAGRLTGPKAEQLIAMLAAFDKHKTYEKLIASGIPTPTSWLIARDSAIETYPVVAKILNGNQGVGVALLQSLGDFEELKATFPDAKHFLLQEFIEEASGVDTRLFVVGDRVVAAMRRVAEKGDFRANLHLGARIERYVPSMEETDLAVQATKSFGLKFAGVDIISSTRGALVLEVNPSPGFGIQEVSDADVALEVIKGVLHD